MQTVSGPGVLSLVDTVALAAAGFITKKISRSHHGLSPFEVVLGFEERGAPG